jgi:hypothetical protein
MSRLHGVQPDKVPAVEGQDRPALSASRSQHLLIGHCLFGLAGFLDSQHIMPQAAEFLNDRQRKFSLA